MNRLVKTFIASVVSEIQQSDIYLTVKARLFETPGANLNGVRVTPAFLSEIVENQEKYVGLPLCADVKNLAAGNYQHLGHLYDARTGEFYSAQIGSFYQFEKEDTADGAALIGYVRIMKRNKAVCRAISELFAENALKFSFEISCGSYKKLDDGTIEINASQDNFLEGAAVVTFPACESAVALDLVAECETIADGREEGETKMTDNIDTAVVTEEITAEENNDQSEVINAEKEANEEAETVNAEQASEDQATSDEQIAELVVTENHKRVDEVEVYDTDTGASVREVTVHEVTSNTPMQETAENVTAEEEHVAETEPEDEPEDEVPEEENASCHEEEKKATAETELAEDAQECTTETVDVTAELRTIIAELREELESIKTELSELKRKPEQLIAEAVTAQAHDTVNPFVVEPQKPTRYSLLETDEHPAKYSLLDRG